MKKYSLEITNLFIFSILLVMILFTKFEQSPKALEWISTNAATLGLTLTIIAILYLFFNGKK